jgi:hypothetical protein
MQLQPESVHSDPQSPPLQCLPFATIDDIESDRGGAPLDISDRYLRSSISAIKFSSHAADR